MNGRPTLRLATRASRQAVAQATAVGEHVTSTTGHVVELVMTDTLGDRRTDVALHTIGGQGVFVKEVQEMVLAGHADIAVHSAKDLPSASTPGLVIGAFTARRTANDALVGARLEELASGATVATGSIRRRAQLAAVRQDLDFVELRGNIDTRLAKIPDGGAIVMAVAALEILGLTERIAEALDVSRFVPAVGQGCVAVECRADDDATRAALAAVDDAATRAAVEVERAFLAELGAGCSLPLGAHVVYDADSAAAVLHTFLATADATDATDGWPPAVTDTVALGHLRAGATTAQLDLARSAARAAREAVW